MPINITKMLKDMGLATYAEDENSDAPISTPTSSTESDSEVPVVGPKKVLMAWGAPSRPELGKINPRVSRTLLVIGAFIGVLLLLLQSWFLIIAIVSLVVIQKVLRQTPPEKVHYEISSYGVKFEEHLYKWEDLTDYFVKEVGNLKVAVISTRTELPGRLYLTYLKKDEEKIIESLGMYLTFLEEEPKTFLDKAYDFVIERINLED